MEWDDYREICDRKNVFSAWALQQTHAVLSTRLRETLTRGTPTNPIAKPADHKGDSRTDMYELQLDQDNRQQILTELVQHDKRVCDKNNEPFELSALTKTWQEWVHVSV